jgi:hypothetical protein
MFTGLCGAASIRVGARANAASASAAVAIRISGRKMRIINLKAELPGDGTVGIKGTLRLAPAEADPP